MSRVADLAARDNDGARPRVPAIMGLRNGGTKMLYAEAAYFDGDHCAHVAAREEHLRLRRITTEGRKAATRGKKWWQNLHAAGSPEAYAWDIGHTEVRRG